MDTTICRAHAQKLVCPCELLGLLRFLSGRRSFFTEGKNIELTDFFPPRTLQYIAKMLQEVSENWETENNTSRFDTCKIIMYLSGSTSLFGKLESP